jgi:hypothetical protein
LIFIKIFESTGNGETVLGYQIQRQENGGEWGNQIITERYATMTTIKTEIGPKIIYRYRVAAFNIVGTGQFSEPTDYA